MFENINFTESCDCFSPLVNEDKTLWYSLLTIIILFKKITCHPHEIIEQ